MLSGHARLASIALAILLAGISIPTALLQHPRTNPVEPPAITDLRWWLEPFEWNGRTSVTRVSAPLRTAFAVPKSQEVWMCGDSLLIAQSSDDGVTWQHKALPEVLVTSLKLDTSANAAVPPNLNAIDFLGPDNGVIGGSSGFLARLSPKNGTWISLADGRGRHVRTARLFPSGTVRVVAAVPSGDGSPETAMRKGMLVEVFELSPSEVDLKEKVRGILVEQLGVKPEQIIDRASLVGDLGADDLDRGELVMAIEEAFGFDISDEEANQVVTVADLFSIVSLQVASTQPWRRITGFGTDAGAADVDCAVIGEKTTALIDARAGVPHVSVNYSSRMIPLPWSGMSAWFFLSDTKGWIASQRDVVQLDIPSGKAVVATLPASAGSGEITDLYFIAGGRGWAVTKEGEIFTTANDGSTWTWLADLRFRNGSNEEDKMTEWQEAVTGPHRFASMHFRDEKTGWVVRQGKQSAAWVTRDGGRHWRLKVIYAPVEWRSGQWLPNVPLRLPAPWFWITSLLVIGLCLPFWSEKPMPTAEGGIELALASDRPLRPGDVDVLDLGALAAGLSHFLRNNATEPPLTIAITGDWGSGKSSVMSLLAADLRERQWRPVWFNPWHHQKDENILAPLLETIMRAAIPRWWTPRGLRYKARLLYFRARRRLFAMVALGLLLAFSIGFVKTTGPENLKDATGNLHVLTRGVGSFFALFDKDPKEQNKAVRDATNTLSVAKGETKKEGEPNQKREQAKSDGGPANSTVTKNLQEESSALIFAGTILSLLVALWRGLSSFGVNPASLLAGGQNAAKLGELRAKTGFRFRFAREFEEVTRALNPRSMVIVIDDLDRCTPESVIETLEAVNFLVSSGDCFVVIGMAADRVQACIQGAFDKSGVQPRQGETPAEFARNYLDKLVNIKVAVPQPTPQQAATLLARDAHTQRRNFVLRRWVTEWGIALLILSVIGTLALLVHWGGTKIGKRAQVQSITDSPEISPRADSIATPPPNAAFTPAPEITPTVTVAPSPATTPIPQAHLISGRAAHALDSLVWLSALALVLIGIRRLLFAPVVVTENSPQYLAALRLWQPLISRRQGTPRALKRFLNHLRFLASRQRAVRERHESALESFLRRRREKRGAMRSPEKVRKLGPKLSRPIPEPTLVALATLRYIFPHWQCGQPLSQDEIASLPPTLRSRARKLANNSQSYCERFDRLAAGTDFL